MYWKLNWTGYWNLWGTEVYRLMKCTLLKYTEYWTYRILKYSIKNPKLYRILKVSGILQFAEYWSGTNTEVYWIAKYIEYWSVQHAEKYCMLKCMEYWNVAKTEVYWILKCHEDWSVLNTEVYGMLKCREYWSVLNTEYLYYILFK